jgi:hypothetical protein
MAFPIETVPIRIEFYQARKIKLIHSIEKGETWAIIPHICPQLTEKGCRLYPKHPTNCQLFDGRKHPASSRECLWPKGAGK